MPLHCPVPPTAPQPSGSIAYDVEVIFEVPSAAAGAHVQVTAPGRVLNCSAEEDVDTVWVVCDAGDVWGGEAVVGSVVGLEVLWLNASITAASLSAPDRVAKSQHRLRTFTPGVPASHAPGVRGGEVL